MISRPEAGKLVSKSIGQSSASLSLLAGRGSIADSTKGNSADQIASCFAQICRRVLGSDTRACIANLEEADRSANVREIYFGGQGSEAGSVWKGSQIALSAPVLDETERLELLADVAILVGRAGAPDGTVVPDKIQPRIGLWLDAHDDVRDLQLFWSADVLELSDVCRVSRSITDLLCRGAICEVDENDVISAIERQETHLTLNSNFPQYLCGELTCKILGEMGIPASATNEGQVSPVDLQPAQLTALQSREISVVLLDFDRFALPGASDHEEQLDSARLDQRKLTNGKIIRQWHRADTNQIYSEIFLDCVYSRHGIRIPDKGIIVDVGANIGLFSLFAHWSAPNSRIVAFEPIPEIARLLDDNLRAHGVNADIRQVALGSAVGQSEFWSASNTSLVATNVTRQAQAKKLMGAYANARLGGRNDKEFSGANKVGQEIPVVVRTLSDEWQALELGRIDLLKIDVEGGELEVLDGIALDHWERISQVVVEAHGPELVDAVEKRLRSLGFIVVTEQDDHFPGAEVAMVYARRDESAEFSKQEAHTITTKIGGMIDRLVDQVERTGAEAMVVVPPSRIATKNEFWSNRFQALLSFIAERCSSQRQLTFLSPQDILRDAPSPDLWSADAVDPEECPITDAGLSALSVALASAISRDALPPLKALVVDADNVLWHGVCGEDGPAGISVTKAHANFQKGLLELRRTGILLCLCSRNELADVEEVFRLNPQMPLSIDVFTEMRVNWAAKSENIADMAAALNISPEAILFLDDDPKECEEVGLNLPQVEVIPWQVDAEDRATPLGQIWRANQRDATAEDAFRADFYASAVERAEVASKAKVRSKLINTLDVKFAARELDDSSTARAVQLSWRVNQMNLLLQRRSAREFVREGFICRISHVSDRYGDYGDVGLARARVAGTQAFVSDYLLSCRALGRNIEWAMLVDLAKAAAREGATDIILPFVKGERNQPARGFWQEVQEMVCATRDPAGLTVRIEKVVALDWVTVADGLQGGSKSTESKTVSGWGSDGFLKQPAVTRNLSACRALVSHRGNFASKQPTRRHLPQNLGADVAQSMEIVAKVIGTDIVFPDVPLSHFGVTSIEKLRISWALQDAFGVQVPFEILYGDPSCELLAAALAQAARPADLEASDEAHFEMTRVPTEGQMRVLAADLGGAGETSEQIIPMAFRIAGQIDLDALEQAFQDAIDCHETLSDSFQMRQGMLVRDYCIEPFELIRRTAKDDHAIILHELEFEVFRKPFDLGKGPLLRAAVVDFCGGCDLLVALHHAAGDGWSIPIFLDSLSAAYDRICRPSSGRKMLESSLAPYQARLQKTDFSAGEAFWQKYINRTQVVSPGSARMGENACPAHLLFELPPKLEERVSRLAAKLRTTPFSIYRAAFHGTLALAHGTTSSLCAYPVANRQAAERGIVGFLSNLVISLANFEDDQCFAQMVTKVAEDALETAAWTHVPYDKVRRFLPSGGVTALLTLQDDNEGNLILGDASVSLRMPTQWPSPFPLMLDLMVLDCKLVGLVRYDTAYYRPAFAEAFADTFVRLIRSGLAAPYVPVSAYSENLRRILSSGQKPQSALESAGP